MPRNEEQRKDWQKKYGWHEEEFIETPMLPMNNIEAGCYKCTTRALKFLEPPL
jgi:hypothetical protein